MMLIKLSIVKKGNDKDIYNEIDEIVDLSKIMHDSLVLADANNSNCIYIKTLSHVICEKLKNIQKNMYN